MKNDVPVITIDGPSGTGKGTLCHLLAARLGWHCLDSGALYRILALATMQQSVDINAVPQLVALAHAMQVRFDVDDVGQHRVFLDNEEVNQMIRSEQCGQQASKIAAIPEIRQALLERQRAFAIAPGLVTDGRDMGTVVFPDASLKLYLDASTDERAGRRHLQLKKSGNDVSLAQVVEELIQRDARDMMRDHSPLKPAVDAKHIDTTGLTIVQVLEVVLQLVNERFSSSM